MTEIRPIKLEEADAFLELLCGTFTLDLERARGIFYTEPLFDLKRKWALFEGGEMIAILTTTPLQFGWGKAYGIAGVATKKERRGEGHATRLLDRVHKESAKMGETGALLFAKETQLYEKNGFEPIDRVIRAPLIAADPGDPGPGLENERIRDIYDQWAAGHQDRLRRDEQRWRYWLWHYRICSPYQSGYLCAEPGVLRESIFDTHANSLPIHGGSEWFGTTHMTDQLDIPLAAQPRVELFFMGKDIPGIPQMFMTDQF